MKPKIGVPQLWLDKESGAFSYDDIAIVYPDGRVERYNPELRVIDVDCFYESAFSMNTQEEVLPDLKEHFEFICNIE